MKSYNLFIFIYHEMKVENKIETWMEWNIIIESKSVLK